MTCATRTKAGCRAIWLTALLALVILFGGPALAGKPEKKPKPDPDPEPSTGNYALAFVRTGNLVRITANGAVEETIVRTRDITECAWSPDGSQIAYVRSYRDLWIADPDGSNATLVLVRENNDLEGISWVPDGKHIVFEYGNFDLGIVSTSDGTQVQALGLDSIFPSTIKDGATTPDLDAQAPGWQGWLVFRARHLDHDPESNWTDEDLWTVWVEEVIDSETGGSTFTFDDSSLFQYVMAEDQGHAVLTADGMTIAFVSRLSNTYKDTLVAPLDPSTGVIGTPSTMLTATYSRQYPGSGTWSPDGAWYTTLGLAEGAERFGITPDILIVRADGTGETFLTNNNKIEGSPSWNPSWVNDLD